MRPQVPCQNQELSKGDCPEHVVQSCKLSCQPPHDAPGSKSWARRAPRAKCVHEGGSKPITPVVDRQRQDGVGHQTICLTGRMGKFSQTLLRPSAPRSKTNWRSSSRLQLDPTSTTRRHIAKSCRHGPERTPPLHRCCVNASRKNLEPCLHHDATQVLTAEAWSWIPGKPLHHGICHCGVAHMPRGKAIGPNCPIRPLLAAVSPNNPVKNGSETVTFAAWSGAIFKTCRRLPHAGIMTVRSGLTHSTRNSPSSRRTSTRATTLPEDLPQLGCVETVTDPPIFVPRNSTRTLVVQQEPRRFSPLAGSVATASGLTLRAALLKMLGLPVVH